MILIADSGSTKTDWICLFSNQENNKNQCETYHTQGLNPVFMSEKDIEEVVCGELLPQLSQQPFFQTTDLTIHFYGAGCREDVIPKMSSALARAFNIDKAQIYVQSDLMAAARALCGNQPGIACILGTGSNSCLYDGESIVKNISPMGFILGDEGSGAVLGKHFINYLFKGNSSHQLMKEFTEETGLTMTDIINKVYREPLPNRFLASLAPFIHAHVDDLDVRNLVIDNFRMFFVRNIQHYQSPHLKVNAVGSIAYYFKDCLQEAAIQEGYELGIVLKSPMDGLIKYHQNNK